jgi:hypothetical protein
LKPYSTARFLRRVLEFADGSEDGLEVLVVFDMVFFKFFQAAG